MLAGSLQLLSSTPLLINNYSREINMKTQLDVLSVIFDTELRSQVRVTLENEGHRVHEFDGYHQATAKLRGGFDPDALLLESGGTRPFGVMELRHILKPGFEGRSVLISNRNDYSLNKQAWELGIRHLLKRPVSPSEVRSTITDLHRAIESDRSTLRCDGSMWWALYTHYRHEKSVARMLRMKEFDVFLPLYESVHRWTDRNKTLSLPLFPGYVFVRDGLSRRLEVVSTPGVQTILFYGERVAIIPEVEMQAIQRMLDGPYHAEPHPYLKCGERVRVKNGSLKGIEGILVRKKNLYRLVISVELLARSVAVEVDAADLEPIHSQKAVTVLPTKEIAGPGVSNEYPLRSADLTRRPNVTGK
jgi:transcription antitermination factor NusG